MQVPAEIVFQHCEPSEELRTAIAKQMERLEKFSSRITSCRIAIAGPQTRHRGGDIFQVDMQIGLPGHKDVIVGARHGDAPEHEHVLVAIKAAFDAAVRQLEDAARGQRGQVKAHPEESHGRVSKFLAGEDCGFLETPEGREIYFHRNAVLDGDFDRLSVGSEVSFIEEKGVKGAQASTVRWIDRHRRP